MKLAYPLRHLSMNPINLNWFFYKKSSREQCFNFVSFSFHLYSSEYTFIAIFSFNVWHCWLANFYLLDSIPFQLKYVSQLEIYLFLESIKEQRENKIWIVFGFSYIYDAIMQWVPQGLDNKLKIKVI